MAYLAFPRLRDIVVVRAIPSEYPKLFRLYVWAHWNYEYSYGTVVQLS